MRTPLAIALALLCSGASVAAQPELEPEVIIVVGRTESEPDRHASSRTERELEPMAPAPGLSLAERLLTISGIAATNQTNFAQDLRLSIRGFGARTPFGVRGVMVVLDGVPLTLADGLAQVDLIDPDMLGRVEVLRGPAGSLFGNAAGGVLELETAGADSRPGSDALIRVGGFGLTKLAARSAYAGETSDVAIYASSVSASGFRQRSATKQRLLSARGGFALTGDVAIRLTASVLDAPRGQDPGGLTREQLDDAPQMAAANNLAFATGEEVTQAHVGMTTEAQVSAHETVLATAYGSSRSFFGSIPFRIVTIDRSAGGVSATLRSRRTVGRPLRLTARAEVAGLRDRRENFDNDGGAPTGAATLFRDESVRSIAGLVHGQMSASDRVSITVGARLDQNRFTVDDRLDGQRRRRTFDALSVNLGAAFQLTRGLTAFANGGNSFQTPTAGELARSDDLDPERARSVELGLRVRRAQVSAEVSGYATALRDELIPFEDPSGQTVLRNAGESTRVGVDAEVAAELPRGARLEVAYSAIRARFAQTVIDSIDLDGNAVPGIVPHRVGAALHWQSEAGVFVSVTYDYTRHTFVDDANSVRRPSQHVVSTRAGVRGTADSLSYEGYIGVANVLDDAIVDNVRINAFGGRYFEPGWPRYAYMGIALGWR